MPKTVLIVYDDPGVRTLLSIILSRGGYEVVKASFPDEALPMLEQRMPDLILSGYLMRSMDGYEFCRRVKEREATRHIPFVLMASAPPEELERKCAEAGVDEAVPIPILHDDLLARLAHVLDR
jgi:CheY-like chemotaxis protein